MKVLLIGSGGREHALAWKLAQSPRVREIVAAPGNAGIAELARLVAPTQEPGSLIDLARSEAPDLTVIGPEVPLVAGLADDLEREGFRVFGPSAQAARLEGSKAHSKEFMLRHGIPTAQHRSFDSSGPALEYLHRRGAPVVVKDSGLAAGKGVTVASSVTEAAAAVEAIFAAGSATVVIEDLLVGQEISYLVFTDGHHYRPMPIAQDYKQVEEGDRGAMTGGMGAVAPVTLLDERTSQVVARDIVERTLAGLRSDGVDYRGVLYFGLMLTDEGPKLLEYNVRLGDPETQVVLPLLGSDLVDVMDAVIDRRLGELEPSWTDLAAACVVMAAPGYPGIYRQGIPLRLFAPSERLMVFHAGTARDSGNLVSSGGRVLNIVAVAEDVRSAVDAAYAGVRRIDFPGAQFRRDIGSR
ncbi:MAG: phosphoribosylamine--glycine ligase [Trueperaceae bacterium]